MRFHPSHVPSYSATYWMVNFPGHIAGTNASGCEHSVQWVWILMWSSTEGDTDQWNKPITAVHCLLSMPGLEAGMRVWCKDSQLGAFTVYMYLFIFLFHLLECKLFEGDTFRCSTHFYIPKAYRQCLTPKHFFKCEEVDFIPFSS